MAIELPPEPARKSNYFDIDLYCLECGYNLRGLSGDPRRCPECGHLNPLEELLIPAKLIKARLRQMETAPALCVGIIVLAILCVLITVLVRLSTAFFEPEAYGVAILPCVLVPVVWKTNARKFRESCLDRAGWRAALWRYHARSIPLCLLVASMVLAASPLHRSLPWGLDSFLEMCTPLLYLGLLPVIGLGGGWVHRGLRSTLAPLQRDVAVSLARQEAERRRARRVT